MIEESDVDAAIAEIKPAVALLEIERVAKYCAELKEAHQEIERDMRESDRRGYPSQEFLITLNRFLRITKALHVELGQRLEQERPTVTTTLHARASAAVPTSVVAVSRLSRRKP